MRATRRQFVQGVGAAGLSLVAGCGRLPFMQPAAPRVYRIGYLNTGPAELTSPPTPFTPSYEALRDGLRDHGYVEGQNLVIEFRVTDKGEQRLRELTSELVRLPVDVLVTAVGGTLAARQATDTVPIVFISGGDPVARGLAASLARPGGNLTGVSDVVQGGGLTEKQLELLREVAPGLSRVAVLEDANVDRPEALLAARAATSQALALQLLPMNVRRPDELVTAFENAAQAHADGLLFVSTPLLLPSRPQIADLALRYRLPSISQFRDFVDEGGLMAYGPSLPELYRRAAYYVDRILKGTRPADLPIEQPTTFDFVINLKTAQALGLTIPQHVLLQATEVIQ